VASAALPTRRLGARLAQLGLPTPIGVRRGLAPWAAGLAAAVSALALATTGLDLQPWQTPAVAALVTFGMALLGVRWRAGRLLVLLALLPLSLHLGLATLGIHLSTGRPHPAILAAWALASALLALGLERWSGRVRDPILATDLMTAGHLSLALGALELMGAVSLVPDMRPGELAASAAAACAMGAFATLRALETRREAYAWLAQAAVGALYATARLETSWWSHTGSADALASIALAFGLLALNGLARVMDLSVFERPTRVATHLVPLAALVFARALDLPQMAGVGVALAVHYAAVSLAAGGSKPAALLSGAALNAALALTWIHQGRTNPEFYALPFGATLLAFSRIFQKDLDPTQRFWLRTVGILSVYVASVSSSLIFSDDAAVFVCAGLCIVGALLGVLLRVKVYVYLGAAFLVVDVLGNMARYGLRSPTLGATFLTLVGLVLLGGAAFFNLRRSELLARYRLVQDLLAQWE
jgi:hypothetical protein